MQIRQRIKKLERQTGINDKSCRCGTPYIATFVVGGENIVNHTCPLCGREVKPAKFGAFLIDTETNAYEVIEPKAEFTREEFEDWQKAHVISAHITYEEHLAQKNKRWTSNDE